MSDLSASDFYYPSRWPAINEEPDRDQRSAMLEERDRALEDWLRQLHISAGGGGVTDHGALTGLGDNDHPQYLLVADAAETIYDAVADILVAGSGITLTPDDGPNTIEIESTGGGGSGGGTLASWQLGVAAAGFSTLWTPPAAIEISTMRVMALTPSTTALTTGQVWNNGTLKGGGSIAIAGSDSGLISFTAFTVNPGDRLQTYLSPGAGAAGTCVLVYYS